MPTKNRRIATYLPQEIDVAFKAFKSDRNIEGDSQALITILSEFLEVSQQVAYLPSAAEYVTKDELEVLSGRVAYLSEQVQGIDRFVEQAIDRVVGELSGKLLKEDIGAEVASGQLELLGDDDVQKQLETLHEPGVEEDLLDGLSARKLAERFNKKGASRDAIARRKDLPDFSAWSATQDPMGVEWEYRGNKFYRIQNATGNSLSES